MVDKSLDIFVYEKANVHGKTNLCIHMFTVW